MATRRTRTRNDSADMPARSAGVFLHPTSLPSGRLDHEAYRFVDFLAAAGVTYWQCLPLGIPDAVGSPYASPSAFACSPALLAHPQAPVSPAEASAFRKREAAWIDDYLTYKGAHPAYPGEDALADQVRFEREWTRLRDYAAARSVRLFGDLALYVASDGADQLAHPELFLPGLVAGAAPDLRHPGGQHWGNPLYDWPAAAAKDYRWWIERLRRALSLFDLVRIDHFRGFAGAWAIPAEETDPARGSFIPGPGAALFTAATRALGELPLVVEDLGLITPDVIRLRNRLGYPGMAVLVRGFDGPANNPSRPENQHERQVVYTSTHDTDTARGWYRSLSSDERAQLEVCPGEPHWSLIARAAASPARLAIFATQDLLGLGSAARINTPGTVSTDNWSWRLHPGELDAVDIDRFRALLVRHDRATRKRVKPRRGRSGRWGRSASADLTGAHLRVILERMTPFHTATPAKGAIRSPEANARVGRRLTVTGEVSQLAGGRSAWVAVEIGPLLWPKAEIAAGENTWTREFDEAGSPGEPFALVLLDVGWRGNRQIRHWFKRGPSKGYAGLPGIKGSRRITDVHGLTLE